MKIIKHHQTTDESLTQSLSIFDWLWESSSRPGDGFEHFSVNPLTLHSLEADAVA